MTRDWGVVDRDRIRERGKGEIVGMRWGRERKDRVRRERMAKGGVSSEDRGIGKEKGKPREGEERMA